MGDVLKSLVGQILTACQSRGEAVSETVCTFMVKAMVMDPHNQFADQGGDLSQKDLSRLIEICVQKLTDLESPSLFTIKMQVFFDSYYSTEEELVDEHRKALQAKLAPIVREITDSRARSSTDLEALYRKMVSYILLRSELGHATDITVVREAAAALESVFPQTELGTFMALLKREKEIQLRDLTSIVSGIRLFNKDCNKGGEGIENLPVLVAQEVGVLAQRLRETINETQLIVQAYAETIRRMQARTDPAEHVWTFKQTLTNGHQYLSCLQKLENDVLTTRQKLAGLSNKYRQRLDALRVIVKSKTAVPTDEVYPQFIVLSNLWSRYQEELFFLTLRSEIATQLVDFSRPLRDTLPADLLAAKLDTLRAAPPEDPAAAAEQGRFEKAELGLGVLYPESTPNFFELPLDYGGFCVVSLVTGDRMLVPGNRHLGIVEFRNLLLSFSSVAAASAFAVDPERYVNAVLEASKASADLIGLLKLHSQFSALIPRNMSVSSAGNNGQGILASRPVARMDSGCQTDTHIMASNIDKNYEWNEWELRRKALKLVNLRSKATHSVQTNLSHFRRENETQVFLPKIKQTQTKMDSHTSVPKRSKYIAGLRGGGNPRVVDLTLDV